MAWSDLDSDPRVAPDLLALDDRVGVTEPGDDCPQLDPEGDARKRVVVALPYTPFQVGRVEFFPRRPREWVVDPAVLLDELPDLAAQVLQLLQEREPRHGLYETPALVQAFPARDGPRED